MFREKYRADLEFYRSFYPWFSFKIGESDTSRWSRR